MKKILFVILFLLLIPSFVWGACTYGPGSISCIADSSTDDSIISNGTIGETDTIYVPYTNATERHAAFRYKVNIPKSATITSAKLTLTAKATNAATANALIDYFADADCDAISTSSWGWPVGGNPVSWTVPSFTAESTYETSNFSSLVQSWIGMIGYDYNQYFGFKIYANGTTSVHSAYQAYPSTTQSKWPTLTITFTGGDPLLDVYMADPHVRTKQYLYVQLSNTTNTQKLKTYLDDVLVSTKTNIAGQTDAGEEAVLVDYTSLTAGNHTLRIVVTDGSDVEYSSTVWTRTWTTLHNGAPYSGIDEDNNLIINGTTKWFPILDFLHAAGTNGGWTDFPDAGDKMCNWVNTMIALASTGYSTTSTTIAHGTAYLTDAMNTSLVGCGTDTYMVFGMTNGGARAWTSFSPNSPYYTALDFSINETFEGTGYIHATCPNSDHCWTTSATGVDPDTTTGALIGSQSLKLDGTVSSPSDSTLSLTPKTITPDGVHSITGIARVKVWFAIKDITATRQETDIIRLYDATDSLMGKVTWLRTNDTTGKLQVTHGTKTYTGSTERSINTLYYMWVEWETSRDYAAGDGVINLWVSTTSTKPATREAYIETNGLPVGDATPRHAPVTKIQFVAEPTSTLLFDNIKDDEGDLKQYVDAVKNPSTYPATAGWFWDDEPDMGGATEYNYNSPLWKDFLHTIDTNHPVTFTQYGASYTSATADPTRSEPYLYMTSNNTWGERKTASDIWLWDYYVHHYSEYVGYPDMEGLATSMDYVHEYNYGLLPFGLVTEITDLSDNMCLGNSIYFYEPCSSSDYQTFVPFNTMTGGTLQASRKVVKVSPLGDTTVYTPKQTHVSTIENKPPNSTYWDVSTVKNDVWYTMVEYVAEARPRYVKIGSNACAEVLDVRILNTDKRFEYYWPKPHPKYYDHIIINKGQVAEFTISGEDTITEYSDSSCSTATGVTAKVESGTAKSPNMSSALKWRHAASTARIYWSPMPSDEATENTAWLQIVHGAKLIAYFNYHKPQYALNKTAMVNIKQTTTALKDIILGTKSTKFSTDTGKLYKTVSTTTGRVDAMARDNGNDTWIFATRVHQNGPNTTDTEDTITATFTVNNLTTENGITVYGEDRIISAGNGSFTDTFGRNGYHIYQISPTGGSDSTPPTVTAFVIPSTSSSLIVPITTFTATDNVGVTGYLVNESASTPNLNDPNWNISSQTSYTFATQGEKTLYAWAKDTVGNISSSANDSTTITLQVSHHNLIEGSKHKWGTGSKIKW